MAEDDQDDQTDAGFTPFLEPVEFPPPSSAVQVTFGAESRRGHAHAVNEDHYVIIELGRHQKTLLTSLPEGAIPAQFDEYGYAMVVADGLGAPGDGEFASRIALVTLMHLVLRFGKWNLRIDDAIAREIMGRAHWFYRHVDSEVVHQGMTGPVPRPQTTPTATFGAGRDLFFAHVGHSRAYLFRRGQLMRLTRDHTIGRHGSTTVSVAPLVDVNTLARDLKHILTDTIGMSGPSGPTIDLERFRLDDNDRVLVCTNGLTDMVDEEMIGEVLASDLAPQDQCLALVDLANVPGGDDDVTALVARYHVPPKDGTPR
jgi:PPM family protein phosphatase